MSGDNRYFEDIRLIIALAKIPVSAKLILIYLYDRQGKNKDAWPAFSTICKDCSLSRDTVDKSLKRLESKNFIKIKRENRAARNKTNHYSINPSSLKSRPVRKADQYPITFA